MAASNYDPNGFNAGIQAQITALGSQVKPFVADGAYLTVAQLHASYPPSATYANMSANVSDLYNNGVTGKGIQEVMNCRPDITNGVYKWVPRRSDFNIVITSSGGNVTLTPLVTPPTIILTGTLTSSQTITPLSTNAFVGMKQRIIQNSTLGLFTSTITGLIGSNVALVGNATKDIEYGVVGWFVSS